MRTNCWTTGCLAAILVSAATSVAGAVQEPSINGVVVEDVTRSYTFDRIGSDIESGPFFDKDFYQGNVRSMVIRAPDGTFDFYFHIKTSTAELKGFSFQWDIPTSYTLIHHLTDPEMQWQPLSPAGPPPGTFASSALGFSALWTEDEISDGSLLEGILVLDTDAKAYAATATYQVRDDIDRLRGNYHGSSPMFVTFGPAIPEPETYALMLCGLGALVLGVHRRKTTVPPECSRRQLPA